ncbi:DUF5787 family protein [Halocatena halophila]|uniref:DUF5787 family protein n=1 Tax=Halocatena halophila TaxID=2814576 RepID=UPI002ED109D3
MDEFGFELSLCATLEGNETPQIVSRQLGASTTGSRIVDVVTVTPGSAFGARTRISPATIPALAIDADVGVGRYRYWKAAFDCNADRARAVIDRAVEIGFFERERRGGRTYIRQTARYPDWIGTVRAIENKPDLGAPGALERQLQFDVSLGVCDEVVLATNSHVTGAHLNRIPEAVGVWEFDPDTTECDVIRSPTPLSDGPGVEPTDRKPSHTAIELVSDAQKQRLRRTIAERAYGNGWRVPFPACPHVENHTVGGVDGIPFCTNCEAIVRPATACESAGGYPHPIDLDERRNAHSPWIRRPPDARTEQGSLDAF